MPIVQIVRSSVGNHQLYSQIFENVRKDLGIRQHEDWYGISGKDVIKVGGKTAEKALREFGTLGKALQFVYPEHNWKTWKFKYVPHGFWKSMDNQRQYFDWLGYELQVRNLDDWYEKLSRKVMQQHGGGTLLGMYHGSPMAALMAVYPQHKWIRRKDLGYWKDVSNHRKYFDELGQKVGIKNLEDWYEKLSKNLVLANGGVCVINQYKGSPLAALMAAYPEHNWVLWKFKSVPQGFWKDLANQRNFLDDLGKKLKIQTLDDWYEKLSVSAIQEHGGHGLLHHYKQSPQAALMAAYPQHQWVPWKFSTVPTKFWNSKENISQFLSDLTEKLSIQTLDDWYRVDHVQLSRFRAATLIVRYKGLYQILKQQYPNHPWDPKKFQQKGKKAQRWLLVTLQKIFSNEEILEDYMHPKAVSPSSNRPLQLDVFIPSRSLAFEYQGKQHYQEVGVFSPQTTYQQRDEEKRILCASNNIKLIEVPYWWNRTQESLQQIISVSD